MGGQVKDMYRLPRCLPRWFLRNVSDLSTFRLVRTSGSIYSSASLAKKINMVYYLLLYQLFIGTGEK